MQFDSTDLDQSTTNRQSKSIDKRILKELQREKKIDEKIENRLRKQKVDQQNFGTRANKKNLVGAAKGGK